VIFDLTARRLRVWTLKNGDQIYTNGGKMMYQLVGLPLPVMTPGTGYLLFAGGLLLLAGVIKFLTRSIN
jgi:hypothetical protein